MTLTLVVCVTLDRTRVPVLPELWLISLSFKLADTVHTFWVSQFSPPFSRNFPLFLAFPQSVGSHTPSLLMADCPTGTQLTEAELIIIIFFLEIWHICGPGMVTSELKKLYVQSISQSLEKQKGSWFAERENEVSTLGDLDDRWRENPESLIFQHWFLL